MITASRHMQTKSDFHKLFPGSKKLALSLGEKIYIPVKACIRGHHRRYASNGVCVTCLDALTREWAKKNSERVAMKLKERLEKLRQARAERKALKPILSPEEKRRQKLERKRAWYAKNAERLRAYTNQRARAKGIVPRAEYLASCPDSGLSRAEISQRRHRRQKAALWFMAWIGLQINPGLTRERLRHKRMVRQMKRVEASRVRWSRPLQLRFFRMLPGEAKRMRRKLWKVNNPEKVKAEKKRYSANNPEARRARKARRDARVKMSTNHFKAKDLRALKVSQKGRCYWCKEKLTTYHVDHIWPLAKGGSNGPENICLSCPGCNIKKSDRTPMEWAGRLL